MHSIVHAPNLSHQMLQMDSNKSIAIRLILIEISSDKKFFLSTKQRSLVTTETRTTITIDIVCIQRITANNLKRTLRQSLFIRSTT